MLKSLAAAVLTAATLAACGGAADAPRLPTGVTCTADAVKTIHNVPDRANPDSSAYDVEYAIGWYLGHDGCKADESAWPTFPQ